MTRWSSRDDLVETEIPMVLRPRKLLMFDRAMVRLNRSRRALHRGLAMGRSWRISSRGTSLKRCVRVVHTRLNSTVRHPFWGAAGAALRRASWRSQGVRQRQSDRARRIRSRSLERESSGQSRPKIDAGMTPGERGTLDVGSGVVLGALGLGVQFGRWPAWTALIAVGGYLTWVVIYSEATVQAKRWRSANLAWPLPRARSKETSPAPAQE